MGLLNWSMSHIYDRFMRASEEHGLRAWRRELLKDLRGAVLEIGAGTGLNLTHYPEEGLSELVLSEPDPHMRAQLEPKLARHKGRLSPQLIDASAEALPFEDEHFDAVVCTLVLCTVPDPKATLSEVWRVLKPKGTLHVLEHVAADTNPGRLRWQRRIEPVWKHVAGGCHLTRRSQETLEDAGFSFDWVKRESMRKALPIVRPTVRGVAYKV